MMSAAGNGQKAKQTPQKPENKKEPCHFSIVFSYRSCVTLGTSLNFSKPLTIGFELEWESMNRLWESEIS